MFLKILINNLFIMMQMSVSLRELNELKRAAIDFVFNIDIIRDNTYIHNSEYGSGGLEYEDLEYSDPSITFTTTDYTVYSPDNEIITGGFLFINFITPMEYSMDDKNYFEERFNDLISYCKSKNLNLNFVDFFPLSPENRETFNAMFKRTELNGIVTMDFLMNNIFEMYIKKIIELLKPDKIIADDQDIKNFLQKKNVDFIDYNEIMK
ncbi:hypothetical protein TZ01_01815 [Acidiplasma sp. MBA-1]|nr:hypothetical protein TZ01_01815 [Acidiplasma sp. MBA-1]